MEHLLIVFIIVIIFFCAIGSSGDSESMKDGKNGKTSDGNGETVKQIAGMSPSQQSTPLGGWRNNWWGNTSLLPTQPPGVWAPGPAGYRQATWNSPTGGADNGAGFNDWNQYIRDEAQRIVYTKNYIARGGPCFPELVGWPVGDASQYIKGKCPELYVVLNDERVPQRLDIWWSKPNRVILTFDSQGLVSRIPMTG